MFENVQTPVRLTAFHRKHLALGAKMIEEASGWMIPESYSDTGDEMTKATHSVSICDISACYKIDVKGLAIDSYLQKNFPGQSVSPRVGKIAVIEPGKGPTLHDRVYVCRMARDQALIVTPSSSIGLSPSVLDVDKSIAPE